MDIHIFVQARMSSQRFPGKMLTDFQGKPLIDHVVEACRKTGCGTVVLTSHEQNDDPLAGHCDEQGYTVFRGSLNNVFLRFQEALQVHKCDAFMRICGDSPMLDTELLAYCIRLYEIEKPEFLSNVIGQTFPKGQSIEIIDTKAFLNIEPDILSDDQKEHVTPYFHENISCYKACLIDYDTNLRHLNMCVDEQEDLQRLQSDHMPFVFEEGRVCLQRP